MTKNTVQAQLEVKTILTFNSDLSRVVEKVRELSEQGTVFIAVKFPPASFFASRVIADLVICMETLRDAGGMLTLISEDFSIKDAFRVLGICHLVDFQIETPST